MECGDTSYNKQSSRFAACSSCLLYTSRKKNPQAARLCADDVMTQKNLKRFQDTYAEAMGKYGLKRGVDGSEARDVYKRQD